MLLQRVPQRLGISRAAIWWLLCYFLFLSQNFSVEFLSLFIKLKLYLEALSVHIKCTLLHIYITQLFVPYWLRPGKHCLLDYTQNHCFSGGHADSVKHLSICLIYSVFNSCHILLSDFDILLFDLSHLGTLLEFRAFYSCKFVSIPFDSPLFFDTP